MIVLAALFIVTVALLIGWLAVRIAAFVRADGYGWPAPRHGHDWSSPGLPSVPYTMTPPR